MIPRQTRPCKLVVAGSNPAGGSIRGRSLAWENARLGPALLHPFSFPSWSYEVNSDGHINHIPLSHINHGVVGHINLLNIEVPLSEELLNKFREWYSTRVKGKNTVGYNLRYIRWFGHLLNSDKLTFMKTLSEDSRRPYILDALSNYTRFLDDYFNTDIYHRKFEYLKRGLRRSKERKEHFTGVAPTLSDLEAFYHALVEYGYSAAIDLFRIALFSGCRPPGEARLIVRKIGENKYFTVNKVAVVHVWKITNVKNLYISLIPVELLNKLKQRKGLGRTFKVKQAWNYARQKTGLKTLIPYDLRDFYATWLRANGIGRDEVNLLQGRLPSKKVLEEHYLDLKTPTSPYIQTLTSKYRVAIEPLIPKFL